MARAFDDASSQALTTANAVVSGTPLTIAGFFYSDDLTVQQAMVAIADTAGTNNWFALLLDGTTAGDPLLAISRSAGSYAYATSTVGYSANTWQHAAAVFASPSSRSIYLDGANKVTNTATLADPFGLDYTAVGRRTMSSSDSYLSGRLAEVGVWNVALDDDEIAALAKGVSPKLIRPASLVAYWPLVGNDSPEPDLGRGQYPLTLVASPTKAAHPRTIAPTSPKVGKTVTFTGTRVVSPVRISAVVGTPQINVSRTVTPVPVLVAANNARPGTVGGTFPGVLVNGAFREVDTLLSGAVITEALNDEHDTAVFTLRGIKPRAGETVAITYGETVLFAGVISRVTQRNIGLRENIEYGVQCDDYTALLDRRLVSAQFTNMSATDIVVSLLGDFTSGFTTVGVVSGLPDLDDIAFTDETVSQCLTRLAQRVGAYWYIDADRDVHFFLEETDSLPSPITDSNLEIYAIEVDEDASQVRNRVFVEGGGSTCPVEVPPGHTALPVDDPSWYLDIGGWVKVGPQHVSYAGVDVGGDGCIVGTGIAAPSNAPTVAKTSGGSLSAGQYAGWKVSFGTASGETLAGPVSASLTMDDAAVPSNAPNPVAYFNGDTAPHLDANATYGYGYTFYQDGVGETTLSPFGSVSTDSHSRAVKILKSDLSAPPAGAVIRFYRTEGGGSTYYLQTHALFSENATYYFDQVPDANLSATTAPGANTLSARSASLSDIPISPSPNVTKRYIYRPVVGGSTFKRVATINDNTTTTYADVIADGSLGATEPSSDTSGLSGENGQVTAGASTIPVSSGTPFSASGGYVRFGAQVVYYGGKTATSLTNIPTSGPGSLLSSIQYGQGAIAVPTLTGVPASGDGAIAYDVLLGTDVNVLAIVEDTASQSARSGREGGDGVHEHLIQDRRLSAETAEARAYAELALYANPITTVRYVTRDPLTRAGKTISINLGHPTHVVGDLVIQRVTRTQLGMPTVAPLCSAEASSVKFSLDDVFRRTLTDSA